MKRPELLLLVLFACVNLSALAQNENKKFKLMGQDSQSIQVEESFSESTEISLSNKQVNKIYGLATTAEVEFTDENGYVRFVLIDNNFNEYLVFESYPLLNGSSTQKILENCEESSLLDGIKPYKLQIEISNANVNLEKLTYSNRSDIANIAQAKKDRRKEQNLDKIERLNKNLKSKGLSWVAASTEISELSYEDRRKLYGDSPIPPGFEFYAGGVYSTETSTTSTLKSATASSSPYIDEWDWRNRHGKDWISPIANQGSCGSCWAFASTGAVEAMTNLYFNQQLNLDLSEQDVLSCSGGGSCSGGYPRIALDYISTTGVVDEATFPYAQADLDCSQKGSSPSQLIKIAGRTPFASTEYPRTEDDLKRMLIEMGPVSGGLYDWSHAMVLVGYKVVKEGDYFYYRNLDLQRYWIEIQPGDPLIGKTVWIFKNSWGPRFGDDGYVFVETPISNIGWTHGIKTPITSEVNDYEVVFEDRDGDGYYWWGLGEKPASCPGPDMADGDDSDPTKGPVDEYGYCMPLNGDLAPVASFSSDKQEINVGDSIQLTDLSTNSPTSWYWEFTGGSPSTSVSKNPIVTYENTGTYPIKLTVSNAVGSDTKTIEIQVTTPVLAPVVDFTSDAQTILENEEISFYDNSSNTPTSWSWVFEGGTPATSTSKNPTVSYSTEGNYGVTLTVSNAGGTDSITMQNFVTVNRPVVLPVANFTSSTTSVETGESVTFTDISENNPYAWLWEFEGGTPGSSNQQYPPNVTYNTPGNYQVKLTVTNNDGSDTKTLANFIEVIEQPDVVITPVADFSVSSVEIEVGDLVAFTDQSTNAPTSWAWTFEGGDPETSSEQNPTVTYNTAGEFSVSLTATNASGSNTKSATQIIHVITPVEAPVADFEADKTQVTEGEAVNFNDKSLNAPASWLWVFEGGTPSSSTERNPRVTYPNANANNYKVSLTVSNAGGNNTKTIEDYIKVEQAQPEYCIPSPIASEEWISNVQIGNNFNTSGAEGYADFTSTTFTVEAGTSPYIELIPDFVSRSKFEYWSVWIDFNSNYVFSDEELVFSASKSKSAVSGTIRIPAGLDITTRIRVAMGKSTPTACNYSDFGEVEDYTLRIIPPQPKPPVADFAANKYIIYVGESIQFSDLSTNDPDSWSWTFPGADNETSSLQNPEVTYSTAGIFNVALTVSKTGFAASTETKQALITVKELGEVSYCTPIDINSSSNYISEVKIGSYSSLGTGGDGYSLNGTINFSHGSSYSVELIPSITSSRNFWRIWIDFNNDGDFDDADETILTVNNNKGNVSSYIEIPTYAAGTTRMRITMKTGKAPASCDDYFEGEVEDYEVSFSDTPQTKKIASGSAVINIGNQNNLSVYPNPTENRVNLRLSYLGDNDSYAVYNATGGKVIEKSISAPLSEIDLSAQPSGLYFVVIKNQNHSYTEKIIKK